MIRPTEQAVQAAVRAAMQEDVGSGDVTTLACIPPEARSRAVLRCRQRAVLCGVAFAEAAFVQGSPNLNIHADAMDGVSLEPGAVVMTVEGSSQALLTAERVALNFVQRLSGVATLTAQYVAAVSGTGARILDTRKTTPGWRVFEKYAVRCGGGENHRMGLHDRVLIKDNHLAALAAAPNPIAAAVTRSRSLWPELLVEVEADSLDQVRQAADAGADCILLDNMTPALLREAVVLVAGRARTEASGGVSLATVRAIAESGVDFISVGALTHSAPAVDFGLDFEA